MSRRRLLQFAPAAVASALARYLRLHGLTVDQIVSVAQSRVRGTPTLLLVDRSGVIEAVWLGKVSRDVEQEIISAVTAT